MCMLTEKKGIPARPNVKACKENPFIKKNPEQKFRVLAFSARRLSLHQYFAVGNALA